MSDDRLLTRAEQSTYLKEERGVPYAKSTLQKLASTGGGPKYVMIGGRALSTKAWLDEWIEARMSAPRHSTSEDAA